MVDRAELRRLAEAAIANRKHMVAVGTAASCRDTEMAERAFRDAASPDAVLGLLDEIEALAATGLRKLDADTIQALMDENDRLRSVYMAERDQHVAHNRAMISQREAERETLMKIAEEFKAERDQLRAVAVRLRDAIEDAEHDIREVCGFLPSNDDGCDRFKQKAKALCEALADPEVEKL